MHLQRNRMKGNRIKTGDSIFFSEKEVEMNSSFKNAPHENNFKAFRRESGRQSNLKLERNLYNRVQATSVRSQHFH